MEDLSYSPKLQKFFCTLGNAFYVQKLAVIIRDFYDLPKSSSFDVDFLYYEPRKQKIWNSLSTEAEKAGLFLTIGSADNGFLVFVVDLDAPEQSRHWAYLEFHKKVTSKCLRADVFYNDVTTEYRKGLPLPSNEWELLFLYLKYHRKDFREISIKKRIEASEASQNICIAWLRDGEKTIAELLKANPREKPTKEPLTQSKFLGLRKTIFVYTPFNKGKSILFTVQGPDGVGKTTLNLEMEKLLNTLPINFLFFHHITGWKKRDKHAEIVPSARLCHKPNEQDIRLTHKIMRFVYRRFFPDHWKTIWLDFSNFSKYVVNINKLIFSRRHLDTIHISDRYIEDMYIKTTLAGHPRRNALVYRLVSMFVERPMKCFLLEDTAENITKRKKELNEDQIEAYYTDMKSFLRTRGSSLIPVNVRGKEQHIIARIVVLEILKTLGPQIIHSIKSWKHVQES